MPSDPLNNMTHTVFSLLFFTSTLGMAPPDADHAWVLEEDVRWAQEIVDTQMHRESQIWDEAFCSSMNNMLKVSEHFTCV
jgi:hypothetical protein